jgi:hypothetical protein
MSEPSPLAGKLFDEWSASLTPSHAVKSGRRYRYYVSRRLIDGQMKQIGGDGWRLPAPEIKRIVTDSVGKYLDKAGNPKPGTGNLCAMPNDCSLQRGRSIQGLVNAERHPPLSEQDCEAL